MRVSIIFALFLLSLVSVSCAQKSPESKRGKEDLHRTSKIEKVMKTESEWKDKLSPMEYHVTREKGTERAFTGKYWDHKDKGVYTCRCCGNPLFDSDTKYKSGSGWPSFYQPLDSKMVGEITDKTHGMVRTEVVCNRCDAHLGHVFNDGPQPTGMRYCINSASLSFVDEAAAGTLFEEVTLEEEGSSAAAGEQREPVDEKGLAQATFGAGCFWCVEAVFQEVKGVKSVSSGYTGGGTKNPTYKEVCSGTTGHAEVARIVYDPQIVGYADLLEIFWQTHDPTTLNRQGNDAGTQYRSVIYYHNDQQKEQAEHYKKELDNSGAWPKPIVTEISSLGDYYEAENYHQNYFIDNPNQGYCRYVIQPKMEKFRKAFKDKLKK